MLSHTTTSDQILMRRTVLQSFYLDWTNNWLTVEKMSEWYGLSEQETSTWIDLGRIVHEEIAAEYKDSKK